MATKMRVINTSKIRLTHKNPLSPKSLPIAEWLIVDVSLVSQKIMLSTLDFDTFKPGKTNKILIQEYVQNPW
jgi:hypothetical protein